MFYTFGVAYSPTRLKTREILSDEPKKKTLQVGVRGSFLKHKKYKYKSIKIIPYNSKKITYGIILIINMSVTVS